MNCCSYCVHFRVCDKKHTYEGMFKCPEYTNVFNINRVLRFDDYLEIIDHLAKAKESLMKIRKSNNRDSVEFALDRIDHMLKGD